MDESLHFAEFGRPKLLFIPTERSPGVPEDEPASAPAPSDGGSSTSTACLESLIEIDDDDEWGTGDDELVRTKFDDDVVELTNDDDQVVEEVLKVEEDEPPPSTSGLNQCPFCGRGLTNLDPLVSFPLFFLLIRRVSHFSLSSGHTITHQ